MQDGKNVDTLDSLTKRCVELFGHVVVEKAGLRLMRSHGDFVIIKCRLDQVSKVLVAIALTDPPMVSVDMSASVNRLRKRIDV